MATTTQWALIEKARGKFAMGEYYEDQAAIYRKHPTRNIRDAIRLYTSAEKYYRQAGATDLADQSMNQAKILEGVLR